MIPNVAFNVSSRGLRLNQADIQKIPGLVLTGVTVAGVNQVTAGVSYQIFSLDEAVNLGIAATGTNAFAYKHIKDFYDQAKKGAELWFMLVVAATTMEQMADLNELHAKKLLADAGGKIRILGIVKKSGAGEVIANGVDQDVDAAVIKAQALAVDYASRYQPFRVILSGNKFSGVVADLKDYTTTDFNRVACLLSNNDGAGSADVGMAIGRLATIPTQRKISRVKDGAVEPLAAKFTSGATVESMDTAWDVIDAKGYIFMRNFSNRSGYFFTSDRTLTKPVDDFNSLARGLVMDEAVILAYGILTEELSDEVPVSDDGTIHPAIVKGWQNNIENEITAKMVQLGKLSGVKAVIDPNQDVLATNNVSVDLQLLPVGYSDFITVNIGFTTNLE